MKSLKVLFLCKKNDKYSKLCKDFLIKKFTKIQIIESNRSSKKKLSFLKWEGDLILSFRSHIILKKKIIHKTRIACVNFHPSTPKYRGFGGINYAIYNKDKYFGCTAHLITDEKLDSGKILNVKRFKLSKNLSLRNILDKTHKTLYFQLKSLIPNLMDKKGIKILVKKSKKENWSKIYNNKQKLDNFYIIQPNEKNIKEKVRSTYLNNKYSPHYVVNGKKKILKKNEIQKFIKN